MLAPTTITFIYHRINCLADYHLHRLSGKNTNTVITTNLTAINNYHYHNIYQCRGRPINIIQDNFLEQVTVKLIRTANILDLVLTNSGNIVNQGDVGGQLGTTDHSEFRLKLK